MDKVIQVYKLFSIRKETYTVWGPAYQDPQILYGTARQVVTSVSITVLKYTWSCFVELLQVQTQCVYLE